jgi:hypothetical protein
MKVVRLVMVLWPYWAAAVCGAVSDTRPAGPHGLLPSGDRDYIDVTITGLHYEPVQHRYKGGPDEGAGQRGEQVRGDQ